MLTIHSVDLAPQKPVLQLSPWEEGDEEGAAPAPVAIPRAIAEQLHALHQTTKTQRGHLVLTKVEDGTLHLAAHEGPDKPSFAEHTLAVPPHVADLLSKALVPPKPPVEAEAAQTLQTHADHDVEG